MPAEHWVHLQPTPAATLNRYVSRPHPGAVTEVLGSPWRCSVSTQSRYRLSLHSQLFWTHFGVNGNRNSPRMWGPQRQSSKAMRREEPPAAGDKCRYRGPRVRNVGQWPGRGPRGDEHAVPKCSGNRELPGGSRSLRGGSVGSGRPPPARRGRAGGAPGQARPGPERLRSP
ncbi:unnamed protein product, partial [Bubo scandiacus]